MNNAHSKIQNTLKQQRLRKPARPKEFKHSTMITCRFLLALHLASGCFIQGKLKHSQRSKHGYSFFMHNPCIYVQRSTRCTFQNPTLHIWKMSLCFIIALQFLYCHPICTVFRLVFACGSRQNWIWAGENQKGAVYQLNRSTQKNQSKKTTSTSRQMNSNENQLSGYLKVKGTWGTHSKFWFVLKGTMLARYKTPKDATPQDTLELNNKQISIMNAEGITYVIF